MAENTLGQRLKQCIDKTGKSQKEIAALIESSPVLISNIISGKRGLGPDIQKRLRNIGFDVDWILTGRIADDSTYQKGELLAKYFIPNANKVRKVIMESDITDDGIHVSVYAAAQQQYTVHELPVRKVADDVDELETIYETNKPVQRAEKVAATAIKHKK